MIPMVSIVGAGPGDPELLTLKALNRIESAHVIFHDSLVGEEIISALPDSSSVIDVGKRPDGERTSQSDINRRMIRAAERGRKVVRLKGGDPTIFGRGGEEAQALAKAGIPFEFIPGITSAIAAPQVAGIPLTHRNHASHLTIITGHEDPTKEESALDWGALASNLTSGGSLVILMGVGRLAENVEALQAHGVSPSTPVAMIERGTLPDEFSITGTLKTIVNDAQETGISPPAVTIIGEVVSVGSQVQSLQGETQANPRSTHLPRTETVLSEEQS